MNIPANEITAFIVHGCGKSIIKNLNRMNDLVDLGLKARFLDDMNMIILM